jgi:hypothetical protein
VRHEPGERKGGLELGQLRPQGVRDTVLVRQREPGAARRHAVAGDLEHLRGQHQRVVPARIDDDIDVAALEHQLERQRVRISGHQLEPHALAPALELAEAARRLGAALTPGLQLQVDALHPQAAERDRAGQGQVSAGAQPECAGLARGAPVPDAPDAVQCGYALDHWSTRPGWPLGVEKRTS